MINRKMLLGLFMGVAILQAFVPLYMAWRWENILQTGQRFYWKTAPVDPYDAFKGRYVYLGFKENKAPVLDNTITGFRQKAYALIAENAEGQAFISGVTARRPEQGIYINVDVYRSEEEDKAYVILPFSRYYLPEDLAPVAEAAYHKSAAKSGIAAVRIKDGYGVIEQLYIEGKPLNEFLRQPQ